MATTITINADLSATIETEDRICRLPVYNPETSAPWTSEAEVQAFAERIADDVRYMAPKGMETVVFPTLTRRQLRIGLLSIGVTAADVEAQIATIADPAEQAAAMIEWQDASEYKRDHPLIAQVADALGLPESQVDALWMWAAGL